MTLGSREQLMPIFPSKWNSFGAETYAPKFMTETSCSKTHEQSRSSTQPPSFAAKCQPVFIIQEEHKQFTFLYRKEELKVVHECINGYPNTTE